MDDSGTRPGDRDRTDEASASRAGRRDLTSGPRAVDRATLSREGAIKTSRWPRTARRQERIGAVIARRQPTVTIVLEDVHDAHNVSAVLRSCDAIGILDLHLVYDRDTPPQRALHDGTSGSAAKWISPRFHASIEACYASLRESGHWIFATALSQSSVDLYHVDLTQPIALVFGNEMRGVSERAIDLADGRIHIPMQGMVESLNISVACAVALYEVMRQRREAGMYDTPQLDAATRDSLWSAWIRR